MSATFSLGETAAVAIDRKVLSAGRMAEGVRWLTAAADDGSVDAANELEVVEQAGGRTDQARDSVRKHRCGAPSRFMNVR